MRSHRPGRRARFDFGHIENLERRTVFSVGQLDLTFGSVGQVRTEFDDSPTYGDMALATAVDSSGRVLVAGEGGMARFLTDGSLDTSFGDLGRAALPFYTRALALQSDGKVVVAGGTAEFNSTDFMVARFTTSGELDTSFADDGIAQIDLGGLGEWATCVLTEPNGRIVVAGGAGTSIGMARLLASGELDTTFSDDGWFTRQFSFSDTAYGLARQANGQIVVVGTSLVERGFPITNFDMTVVRVNTNGTVDGNFGSRGMAYVNFTSSSFSRDQGSGIAVLADGKIVISGSAYGNFRNYTGAARLLPDGTLDTDFGNGGRTIIQSHSDVASSQVVALADGRVLVSNYQGVMMLTNQGQLDSSFSQTGYASAGGLVRAMARQSDGGILLAGFFLNGFGVRRLTSTGSVDLSFSGDGVALVHMGNSSDTATHSALQTDGKIVVVGGSTLGFQVARYGTDGSLDTSFSDDGLLVIPFGDQYYDALATAVVMESDGQILVSGWLRESLGTTINIRMAVARLNSDGTLDQAFSEDGRLVSELSGYSEASSMALQPDGKVVIGGMSNDRATLWRLNSDGSYDNRFSGDGVVSMATEASTISSLVLQPDGKILAAGFVRPSSFRTTNYVSVLMVARFNANGSLDASFGVNGRMVDPGNRVRTGDDIALLPDGRFVIVGDTTIYSASYELSQLGVTRYMPDGSLDGSFGSRTIDYEEASIFSDFEKNSARSWGTSVLRQSDGKMVVTGYSDQRWLVARLNEDGSLDSSFNGDGVMNLGLAGETLRATNALLQADNKLVISGTVRGNSSGMLENDFYLVRLTSDELPSYSTSIRRNAQGNIEIRDAWGRDDHLQLFQRSADAIVISDASSDTSSRFRVIDLPEVTGDGTRELTIPLSLIQSTGKSLLINSMGGDDALLISNTFNAPATGLVFRAGDGDDWLSIPQSDVPVGWILSTATSGSARPVGKVPINFTGVEGLRGGTQVDNFRLVHQAGAPLTRIDGSRGGQDTIELRADANMSFATQPLVGWGQRMNVHSSAGSQQISLRFISSARLTGGLSDNVIDASQFHGTVSLYGAAGNDVLVASLNASSLFGDDGDDRLYGSQQNDLLRGGRGNDLLVGSFGQDSLFGDDGLDVLSGDYGSDRLFGGNGEDLLIGGLGISLSYTADAAARDAILATWRSAESYAAKIQKLTIDGVGVDNSVKLQYGENLFNDIDVDTFFGNAGLDWFIANSVTEIGLASAGIRDRTVDEQVFG